MFATGNRGRRLRELGVDGLRTVGRCQVADDAGVDAVAAAGGVADQISLARGIQFGAGQHPLPDSAFDSLQESFRRGVGDERALRDQRDVGGRGFHVGDDVGGENDDAFAGEFREQVAEAHALFGIEAGGGFVDDEQLGIVEQSLRDADALLHASGIAAQRAFADIGEINQVQQFVDALLRRRRRPGP